MKNAYPITISQGSDFQVVYIPDFDINTQGVDLAEAMEMARDAIGMMGCLLEDEKKPLPQPSKIAVIKKESENDILTLVDVDFTEYRRKHEMRSIKKTLTVPSWLNEKAEQAGINFSQVLQEALKQRLDVYDSPQS